MTNLDAVWFKALAERYLDEAAACDQMARTTDLSKVEWLRLAAAWTWLATEADARSRRPN
jgi:hypothetical protein